MKIFLLIVLVFIIVAAPSPMCQGGNCPTPVKETPVKETPQEPPPPEETEIILTEPPEFPTDMPEVTPFTLETPEPQFTEVWHPDFVDEGDNFKEALLPKSGYGPDHSRVVNDPMVWWLAGMLGFIMLWGMAWVLGGKKK